MSSLSSSTLFSSLSSLLSSLQILALTETITKTAQPSESNDPPSSGEAYLSKLLRSKSTELLQGSLCNGTETETTTSQKVLSQCASCAYLKQTIVDDSTLLFLYGQCSVHEIALTMSGLAGLDLCSRALASKAQQRSDFLTGKSLLTKYLEGVETKLQSHLKRLASCGDVPHTCLLPHLTSPPLPLSSLEHEKSPVAALSTLLISAVEILQNTILEVYLIFLQPTTLPSVLASTSSGSGSTNETFTALSGGLFGFHLRQFIHSLLPSQRHLQPSSYNWDIIEQLIHEEVSPVTFLEVWYQWIRTQIEAIQIHARDAFALIDSPADVSKLQRLVSQACLSSKFLQQMNQKKDLLLTPFHSAVPLRPSLVTGDGQQGKDTRTLKVTETVGTGPEVWYDSCVCLLETILTNRWPQIQQQFQHRLDHRTLYGPSSSSSVVGGSIPGPGSAEDGGRMLWIYIFRQPFLTLVERLMKLSCRNVFQTVKKNIITILADLSSVTHRPTSGETGSVVNVKLRIDSSTLEMKYETTEKRKKGSDVSQRSDLTTLSDELKGVDGFAPSDVSASSTELFLHAEKVRLYLENQMTTLMHELLFTVRSSPLSYPPHVPSHSLTLLSFPFRRVMASRTIPQTLTLLILFFALCTFKAES
jgi:hypothetical protein